ncbi:methyltransferase domain-containing protein [Caldimonas thermodepolymerans]|uniref:Thiopurine S-methyltransferase n=1 Tax=Caldimonas thermodepolymerans TaxID=215580 RepID=A0AA46DFY0_9BURK|nr:methyltransferase domain-containing protein [Caldimonas thermodepolymerans]TCP08178.1 thiopurine S-methyltransferase [Caldimonas thermodepolymerans]UZG48705.1 TPMT family class I SAM-dependent methyltransferase [Caldimonas thermodepolymerans]
MAGPDVGFWQERFATGTTPWDRGGPNPQLQQWLDEGLVGLQHRVLVPGCGRGWEVALLAGRGVPVTGIDYAPAAIEACRALLERQGLQAPLVQADVLEWQPDAPVDVVYEQTCLCALHPDHWQRYAQQLHAWIQPGGRLLALFVQARAEESAQGFIKGPPYHCDIHAMRALFPGDRWAWPKPPYPALASGPVRELVVPLTRR